MGELKYSDLLESVRGIGFDDAGVTDAKEIRQHADWIAQRSEQGDCTEFEPKPRGLTRNPAEILAGALHVIVLCSSYPMIKRSPRNDALPLSDIAIGTDYHRTMGAKMQRLSDDLAKSTGHPMVWQVDTGNLQERPFAQKSGMGFIGKNTNLIQPSFGSYVNLGLIVTTAPITGIPDPPELPDGCGACRKCEQACPNGAIDNYRMRASRCVSYLSQKNRLTESEMQLIKTAYGCDICQRVCPKNAHLGKLETDDCEAIPYSDLELSKKAFKEKYGHTSAFWRGPTIIRRNLVLGIGNFQANEYRPLVEKFLQSESEVLRTAAAYSIKRLTGAI